MNTFLRTYTIMPLTSASRAAPFRMPTDFDGKAGFLLAEQLRTVDLARMKTKVGHLDPATLRKALALLRDMFGE